MTDEMQAGEGSMGKTNWPTTWGPKLFYAVLIGLFIFFWWVLIYSGGVSPHHG